jgi:hypothetical protein
MCPTWANAQWTTADGNGNINNTNTNNVGIGTTTPGYKLDITTLVDKAQIRFGLGAIDSGGYLYSNGPNHAALSGGVSVGASGWTARSMAASIIEANLGEITLYANNGLTVGSVYTPTPRMKFMNNGNVGIGTTIPGERLVSFGNFLAGNITNHTQIYSSYDSQGNMIMELGYGTATANITPLPSFVISKNLTGTNTGLGVISFANSNIADGSEKRLASISTFTDGALNSGALTFGTSAAGSHNERLRITSGGNVGIGTATPAFRFDVVSATQNVARFKKTDNTNGGIVIESAAGFNPNVTLAVNGTNKWYLVNNATSSDVLQFWESTGSFPRFTVTQAGTVGIGTGTPSASYKLDVQGGTINTSGGLCIAGDCKTSWAGVGGSQWANGASSSINYGTGNVGIGTTAPTQKLEVNGAALINTIYGSSAASGVLALQSTSSATKGTINIGVDQTTTTSIGQSGTTGNKLLVATDRLIVNNSGVRVNGATDHGDLSVTKLNIVNPDALQFRTTSPNITSNGSLLFTVQNVGGDNVKFNVQNNAVSNAFVIDTNSASPARILDVRNLGTSQFTVAGNGNVGIGTTAPNNKLHVAGSITVDGNINAKYQDVAEWVDSSQELVAGTVVVLDSSRSNQVLASTQSYDSRVAGVISLRPGLTLGEAAEGRVLVATTGRVKVKVDATNGPIQIGDLLVTSDKEGVAMKSAPIEIGGVKIHRPGTLIGKALEPLAQGTGEILVLLSLQ